MFFSFSKLIPNSWMKHVSSYIQPVFVFTYLYSVTFRRLLFPKKQTITNPQPSYIEYQERKFLSLFAQNTHDDNQYNSNINKLFYLKKEYNELMKRDNNMEDEWKTRMLIENTPRGNILMYYDPYKMGFSYYSDNKGIPYNLLNAIAMKYVTIYRCRDFYFDNTMDGLSSPLAKLHLDDEKKEKKKSNINEKESKLLKDALKDGPFAKLKKTKQDNHKDNKNEQDNTPQKKIYTNKFVHLGKVTNFNVLKPSPISKKTMNFSSQYLDDLSQETNLQQQVMSYKDYKSSLPQ